MAKTTEQKLSGYGYSMQEASEYVLAMVSMGQAQALAGKVASLGIDAQDLANIVHVQKQEVVDYFHYQGVDTNLLNAGITGDTLVANFGGDVFLYNPQTGKNKLVFKFGYEIGDIATDTNGDVYAVGVGGGLYRYDFAKQAVEKLPGVGTGIDVFSLGFFGDQLVAGMKDHLRIMDKAGHTLSEMTVPVIGPAAASLSDLLVVGNKLFRNSAGGLTETDIDTGVSREVTQAMNFYTAGIANAGDGWIVGYNSQAFNVEVRAYNVDTGEVKNLPDAHIGSRGVEGASEALQMHVDLWGMV